MRARAVGTAAAILLVALPGCVAVLPEGTSAVDEKGGVFTVGEVTVVVPPGAVDDATTISIDVEPVTEMPSEIDSVPLLELGPPIAITLGDGLQPNVALEVTLPLSSSATIEGDEIAVLLQSADGSLDAVAARVSPDRQSAVASIPHLSLFQPITIDFTAVGDAISQALGLSTPEPECVDTPLTVGDTTYSVISAATAWMCVESHPDGMAAVARSNGPYPYLVTSENPDVAPSSTPDLGLAPALDVVIAEAFGLVGENQASLFTGGAATFATDVRYPFVLSFDVAPVFLWISILTRTLDIVVGGLGIDFVTKIERLECLADVLEAGVSATADPGPSTVAGIYRSFFSCIGPVLGDLPGPQRVLLGIISAAPQLLIGSLLGALSPLNGTDDFDVVVAAELDGPRVSADSVPGLLGTWTGPIDQPRSVPYTTVLTFGESATGNLTGVVRYPELDNCSGYWADFRLTGTVLTATEYITSGTGCVKIVPLQVTLRGDQLDYLTLRYDAVGTLTRSR